MKRGRIEGRRKDRIKKGRKERDDEDGKKKR